MIMPNRRVLTFILGAIAIVAFLSLLFGGSPSSTLPSLREPIHPVQVDDDVLKGGVISSKIGNETVKYACRGTIS